ncbi:MAG TPA: site-2 protease family protein [Streptosporangiaceae bacterium]|jgi:membrane-associated protease RseP (regulator of RpoE activity)|nr:site-2 protease family protein [Streptosporangiaceae bacterium]
MDLIGWAIFLVALLVSVMLHETGHFVLAKKFGMKVTRYFVGFGPTIWSTWRGETEYGIKALPFGGFVKIIGMHSLDEVDDPDDEARAFRSHPAWQRILVLLAGSAMHFILALVLIFGLALGVGIAYGNTTVGTLSPCVPVSLKAYDNGSCKGSHVTAPAKLAGLRLGDVVTAIDGHPVTNFTQLTDMVRPLPAGTPVTVTVRRDGKLVNLHTKVAGIKGLGSYLGLSYAGYVFQIPSPLGAVEYAGTTFGQVLTGSAQAVADLPGALPELFNKNRSKTSAGQVSSVVGAAEITGTEVASDQGWQYKVSFVLLLIASLNIFFGAFNLLPLLPLDGGHIAAIIYERIRAWLARLRGRPDPGLVDMAKLVPVSLSLFVIVIFFSVILVVADIVNPISISGG